MADIRVVQTSADAPEAVALVAELDAILEPLYPSESRHGYSVDKLLQQQVVFFVVWVGEEAAACGGIQLVDGAYGELKRMYVRPTFRGHGLAKRLLQALADYALSQKVDIVRLETGIYQTEAIGLYEAWGFERIAAFGDYWNDPNSLFYEKRLA